MRPVKRKRAFRVVPVIVFLVVGVVSFVLVGITGLDPSESFRLQAFQGYSTLTLSPSALPSGTVDEFYSTTVSASGGTAPYVYSIEGSFPSELSFDSANGVISGTVTASGTSSFTVVVIDATSTTARRDYTLTFSEDGSTDSSSSDSSSSGTTSSGESATEEPSAEDLAATQTALLRTALGPPRVVISLDIDFLAIRTGPFVGASLRNLAVRGEEYLTIGEYRPPGSQFSWYLIEYGSESEPQTGWVSGRFAQLEGFILDVPLVANPFDNLDVAETGVTGRAVLKNNIYRYPAGSAPLVARFDEGSTFTVLGRTVIDRRNFTYWILIRLDRTGQVGWTRYTPFLPLDGEADSIPIY